MKAATTRSPTTTASAFRFWRPKRGRIFDRSGSVLADNEETFRVTLTPALAGDVRRVLASFRRLVPLRQDEIEQIAKRAKKQSRNTPITIVSDITFDQLARINLFAPQLPGIRTEVAWKRRYKTGIASGHIVGYVGSVERPSIDDDALMRLPGMRIGKSGIEAGLENVLRGEGGAVKVEVDARGHMVRNLEVREAVGGSDVTLTLDFSPPVARLRSHQARTPRLVRRRRSEGRRGRRHGVQSVL